MNGIYLLLTKGMGYIAKKCNVIKRPVLNIQDKMTLCWIKKYCKDVIFKYKELSFENTLSEYNDIIWTCWWQGEKNAPEIVKICIESMRRNKGTQRTVVVIDQDNYDSYITLPPVIIDKFEKGYIGVTQLIDIIRVVLLETYGGLWLDASIFVMGEIPNTYFNMNYWTIKNPDNSIACISRGKWTNGVMASCKGGEFVSYMKDMLLKYWGDERILINYFLVDCITHIAFNEFKWYREEWEEIEPENSMFGMMKLFNEEYVEEKWDELAKNSYFYYMTRKKDYIYEKKGKKTFYGHIRDYYKVGD